MDSAYIMSNMQMIVFSVLNQSQEVGLKDLRRILMTITMNS